MHINKGFEVRSVCGENLVVAMGEENIDFSHVITLNETSLFIWNKMLEGIDTIDGIVDALLEEYEADKETVRNDVEGLVNQLKKYKIVSE